MRHLWDFSFTTSFVAGGGDGFAHSRIFVFCMSVSIPYWFLIACAPSANTRMVVCLVECANALQAGAFCLDRLPAPYPILVFHFEIACLIAF